MRTALDASTEPDIPKSVLHLVRDIDAKHVEGHNRLRVETDAREKRISDIERTLAQHEEAWKNAAKRTTDIQSLRFTPAMVGAIVALCGSILGGTYASTAGMRDEITQIRTMIASQDELRKSETKLQDERAQAMADAIKEIKARGEMTDLKVNNLRETVLTNRR